MTTVELYYPETTATKRINDVDGRIFFYLSFDNDLNGNKLIGKNFATSSADNDQFIGHNLFINSAENFPSLSDPNYSDNFATHYLVIFQKNASSNNCLAIPICNNYNGPWSMYAKDLKRTQVRSIDKLIKNPTSLLIDLNSTMNELNGIGSSYKKYNDIEINYQNDDKKTMKITLYVIDKFIYVEPPIKSSFYKQLITNSYKYRVSPDKYEYKIVSISASCSNPNASPTASPSSLFNIGKKPDAFSKFIYINVLITVIYLIILLIFYAYYDSVPIWGLLILCSPLLIYLFAYKTGKKKKEKMENIESFRSKKKKSKKSKKSKIKINYSEFYKYIEISSQYSFIIVSLILLLELYKKMNMSNMNLFTLFMQFMNNGFNSFVDWVKNAWSGDTSIYNILKPVFNVVAGILISISLLWGSIELFFKKIIKS